MFELIEKREELWSQMISLEQRANQPDRYKNRGGQLLREEKERKTIASKLPKIEQELLNMVEKYESESGTSFHICGQPLSEIIEQAWDEHKENKHVLLSARKHAREKTMITPGKSRTGTQLQATLTPIAAMCSSKRKLGTPSYTNTKKTRVVGENVLRTAPSKLHVYAHSIRRVSFFNIYFFIFQFIIIEFTKSSFYNYLFVNTFMILMNFSNKSTLIPPII